MCTKYIKILTVNDTGSIANVRQEETGSFRAGASISLGFKIIFVCFVIWGAISYNKRISTHLCYRCYYKQPMICKCMCRHTWMSFPRPSQSRLWQWHFYWGDAQSIYWLGHQMPWLRLFTVSLSSPWKCQAITQFYFKFSLNFLSFAFKKCCYLWSKQEVHSHTKWKPSMRPPFGKSLDITPGHVNILTIPFHCNFYKDTVPDLCSFCSQNLMIMWYFFSLPVHPFSHARDIRHVNLSLQFIYYKTQLITYWHSTNII